MKLGSYESLRSLLSNEKSFTGFGPAIGEESFAQVIWSKLGRLDRLAFEVNLEGQMKS